MNRLRGAAVVLAVLLAVVVGEPAGDPATRVGAASEPPALVMTGAAGLGELLVPTRSAAVTASWIDHGSAKSRSLPHAAVVATMAGLLVVLAAGVVRRRPGPSWHHLRRHSAVLRAPPILLHP